MLKITLPPNLAPSLPGGYNPLHADYINKLKLFSVAQINFPNPIICDKSREKKWLEIYLMVLRSASFRQTFSIKPRGVGHLDLFIY